jgi:SAM-dependent methyltransferase
MSPYREGIAVVVLALAAGTVAAQDKPYEPVSGQAGRDTVWVPTPDVLVEKMLDMAKVTPKDYVIDLGSGDGRMVIAAAKRGVRGHGVEYNPDMVKYSQRMAEEAGVAHLASFVQGDMYEADISKATVLPLFLLPENMRKLTPNFLRLRPGSRIVVNGFQIPDWDYDYTARAEGDCGSWCTAFMYIVPAKASGVWHLPQGTLVLAQRFQKLSGTFVTNGKAQPVTDAQLHGTEIRFKLGETQYVGRVDGDRMGGSVSASPKSAWSAVRVAPLPGAEESR